MGRPAGRPAGRRPGRRDPPGGHRRPPGAGAVPRRADARLPADGLARCTWPTWPPRRRRRPTCSTSSSARRASSAGCGRAAPGPSPPRTRRSPGWPALAGFPDGAGGCFVSGGSAANLSALVTARHHARLRHGDPPGGRWRFATTGETHASVHAAARVMDVDVVLVPPDERGRMTGAALRAALDDAGADGLFAVVANFGTTNVGAIDELDAIADVCAEHDLWLHIDAAYGGAALCAPSTAEPPRAASSGPTASASTRTSGCSRRTTAPPSSTASRRWRRPPTPSTARTSTWSAATSGTRATSPSTCRGGPAACRCGSAWRPTAPTPTPRPSRRRSTSPAAFAAEVDRRDGFTLLLEPQLSVVLFTVDGWDEARYAAWSRVTGQGRRRPRSCRRGGRARCCYRVCVVNPLTTDGDAHRAARRHGRRSARRLTTPR